jgi:hypothetical protein
MTRRTSIVVLALIVWLPVCAYAQTVSATTGAVTGSVTDDTAAAMPGVTVTITGAALMTSRTDVTDNRGAYRLQGLPPGAYRLVFELAGFRPLMRDDIIVSLGFTTSVDVRLAVSSLEESVLVTGGSPVVDAVATRVQTNYTAERLAAIPNARDIWSVMAASPGVRSAIIDVGGSSAGSQSQFVAYGTRAQNQPMVEGMMMSQIGSAGGSVTFYYDYGSFAEVAVNAAANSADMAMPGVQFQYISKSGGNAFHGSALADYQHERAQSHNIDADQIARGAASRSDNRLFRYHDTNADIGGPLRRDRLWWYTSVRDQKMSVRYPNFPVKPFDTRLRNFTGKGTYQLSPQSKLIAYGQWGKKLQPNRLSASTIGGPGGSRTFAIHETAESTEAQDYLGWVWKGEYNQVLGRNGFVEVRAGQVGYNWLTDGYSNEPRREDIGSFKVTGGNTRWRSDVARNQLLGSLTWFKNDWAGTHNFKVGFEVYRDTQERDELGFPGNLLHVFNNGVPTEVRHYQPSFAIARLRAHGIYLTDSWTLTDRLTANVGLRVDRYRSYLPAQERRASEFATAASFNAVDDVITWTLPAPRVGAAYRLTADGRTVVKAHAGRYWWNPDVNVASSVNPNVSTAYERFAWTDPNGDRLWQRGEEGRLLGRVGGAGLSLDADLENTYTDEFAAWLDRELLPDFGLRTGIVWRGQRQLRQTNNVLRPSSGFTVPVSFRDPGPDGASGTADDGALVTLFNLDAQYLGQVSNVVQNVPDENDYYTWELTADRRFGDGWSLMSSYSFTWNRENLASPGAAGNPVRSADSPVSPNDLLFSEGGRYHHTNWTFKLHAVVNGPWSTVVTPYVRHQAGQQFGRTFAAALNYGSQRILAEPLTTHRQDNITVVDVRLERVFRVAGRRLSARLDLYNLLNSNAEDFITWSSGASYLRPVSIIPPRIARIGAKFDW